MVLETIVKYLPPFLKGIADSIATDGVKGIFTFKKHKREEQRAAEQFETIQEIRTLASRFAFDPSQKIRNLADTLSPLITDLHVTSCHSALDKLRQEVPNDDQRSLSRIDFYLGCCSRYTNFEQSKSEYERARTEMIGASVYDNDIVAAHIFLLCKQRDSKAALQTAEGLKGHDRTNIWAWVPSLVFAENLADAYKSLPADVDSESILFNACYLGTEDKTLGIDVENYLVRLPETITYENIPEWVFDLTVLMNRYIWEWNQTALFSEEKPGVACKEFNEAVRKFRQLSAKTQLGDFIKNIQLWYLMSQYQVTRDEHLLEDIKNCACDPEFKLYRSLAYANFLAKADHFEEAKEYLMSLEEKSDASVINSRLLFSLQTVDQDYAASALQDAVENNVVFNIPQIIYLLSAARSFPDKVRPIVDKLVLPDDKDGKACRQVIYHYTGGVVDVNYLFENRHDFNLAVAPYVALVLHAKGYVDEAIKLSEKGIPPGIIDLRTFIYIEILQNSPAHADKLYKALGDLRRHGFIDNSGFLRQEYAMAARVKDSRTMLDVAKILHQKHPKNSSCFTCYISCAADCREIQDVTALSAKLNEYDFSPEEAGQIFNVLIVSAMHVEALEFLYGYIKSHPSNEGLNMLFHSASINPATSVIINEEYDTVFDGAYVLYLHNGETKSAEVTSATRLKVLIGKTKGEVVEDIDRMKRTDRYEIISIHNHYRQLVEQIYKEIGEGNYTSATPYHFTDEEIKGGHIFDVLNKMVGHDEDWFVQHNEALRQYKEGEMTLAAFLRDDELIPSLYDHLFGTFKIYGINYRDFEQLHEVRKEDVDNLSCVLDLPSLILLFELQMQYNLVFPRRFIISQGTHHLIKAFLYKEMNGSPSSIYQSIDEVLSKIPVQEGELWMTVRLKRLLSWIEQYVDVEEATEILNVDDQGVFSQSVYFTLFYEALALAQRGGRMLVSLDQNVLKVFAQYVPVSDVNALVQHFCPGNYKDVARFFIRASIFGGDIDTEFVLEEYDKHALGQKSWFKNCQENLALSKVAYNQVIDICIAIAGRPILTQGDKLVVESMLHSLFELFERKQSGLILKLVFTKTTNRDVRLAAQSAFQQVHPLC